MCPAVRDVSGWGTFVMLPFRLDTGHFGVFRCSGCVRESAFLLSRVRNSMFEKLDTGINCRKYELPFSSEVFKINSKLCFMGIQS